MFSVAFAQAAEAAPKQPGIFEALLPFAVIFAVFYFLMIRPQSKKMKEHQKFLDALKRGEAVLTSGGIYGVVEGLTDKFVTLEIADGVKVKVLRSQIAGAAKEAAPSATT